MEFLVLYSGSIILSFSMDLITIFRMLKDIGNAGYKINIKKMEQFKTDDNLSFRYLIPGYNIFSAMKIGFEFIQNREMVYNQLITIGALEGMNAEEYKKYQNKPSVMNMLMMSFDENRKELNLVIQIKDNTGISKIYYKYDHESDNITIMNVEGPAANLTVEEQIHMVSIARNKIINMPISKMAKSYLNASLGEEPIDISDEKFLGEVTAFDRKEQIKSLKELKKDLISSKNTDKTEGKVYKRTRKK